MDQVVNWLTTIVGSRISAEAITFIVSLLPIPECRGELLLASILKVNLLKATPLVIIGSILPISFVLLSMRHILNFMCCLPVTCLSVEWLEKRARNKSAGLKRGEFWGLLLFVGIPLPGIGGWTGALAASLMEVDSKKVMLATSLGISLAIFIVTIISYGLLGILFHREAETNGTVPRLILFSSSVYSRLNLFLWADKCLGGIGAIDIRFLRENPEVVKKNIRKKLQERKLPLMDEVIALNERSRKTQAETDQLHSDRNKILGSIGALMGQNKRDEAERVKGEAAKINERLATLRPGEAEIMARIREVMLTIPQIMDSSVPIGKDDSCNTEIQRYGKPVVLNFGIPYHTDIMERLHGIDSEAIGKVAGNGFYYLLGDIARLYSAALSYTRDSMIDRGFTYAIPPYMIHFDVATDVMSLPEMDAMMYKIESEDLYPIGASKHPMIGHLIDGVNNGTKLPYTLISYSPCFRKGKDARGIEERGVYRIHQFEKQKMIVICKPEESMDWYDKSRQNTVDFFRSLDIPVETFECCPGNLTDLKVKNCDVGAWDPYQKKYFKVDSRSNLDNAQARRLRIYVKDTDGKRYFVRTLDNICVAPLRIPITSLKNNLQVDGSVCIPEALRPYTGGKSEPRA